MESRASRSLFFPMRSRKRFFEATLMLLALLSVTTFGANLPSAGAATSTVPPRLGGACSAEFRWTRIPSADPLGHTDLICLPKGNDLLWRAADSLKIDTQLNSILMKCGAQLHPIVLTKTNSKLVNTFRNAVANYISTKLHMKFIKLDTVNGFINLNVSYYRDQGICSNGVGTAYSGSGPDKTIAPKAKLLWEGEVTLLKGKESHRVSFAFARVGTSWRYVGSFEPSYVYN